MDESATHRSGLNCSRVRPDRNNLGLPPDPSALARRVVSSHRTCLSHSSNRDDRTLPRLGRHSRQNRQRKQDSTHLPPGAGNRILGLPIPEEPGRVCSRRVSDGALLLELYPRLRCNGHSVKQTVWPSDRWILDGSVARLRLRNSYRRYSVSVPSRQLSIPPWCSLWLCGHPRGIVCSKRRPDPEEIFGHFERLLGTIETEEHRDSLSTLHNCPSLNVGIQQLLHSLPCRRSKRVPADSRASGHGNNSAWSLCVSPSRAAKRQGGEKTNLYPRCSRICSILHDPVLRHECRNCHCSLDFANLSTSAVSLNRVNVRLHFWGRSRQRTRLARIRNQPRRWTGTLGWRFDRRCGPAPSSHRLLTGRCSRIGCILSDFAEGEAENHNSRFDASQDMMTCSQATLYMSQLRSLKLMSL